MKAYVDTCLVGANRAQNPAEDEALTALEELNETRKLGIVWLGSNRTLNEIELTRDPQKREALIEGARRLERLEKDHRVIGGQYHGDQYGGGGWSPFVVDVPDEKIFDALRDLGLDPMDARHLSVAIFNQCEVFLTRDVHSILRHRSVIEAQFPGIKIMKASELLKDLTKKPSSSQ